MSLINLSLEIVYCSNLASNYGLIKFIRFVSRFTGKLCNAFFILSRFNSAYRCRIFFRILNFATKQGVSWIKTPVLEDIEEPFDAAMF